MAHDRDAVLRLPDVYCQLLIVQHGLDDLPPDLKQDVRAPDLDEITDWVMHLAEEAAKARRLANQLAIANATIADKNREIERLQGRVRLLEQVEQKKLAFALAVQQGEVNAPLLSKT